MVMIFVKFEVLSNVDTAWGSRGSTDIGMASP